MIAYWKEGKQCKQNKISPWLESYGTELLIYFPLDRNAQADIYACVLDVCFCGSLCLGVLVYLCIYALVCEPVPNQGKKNKNHIL